MQTPFEELTEKQQLVILRKIAYPKETYKEIAKATDVSLASLNAWGLNALADMYRKDIFKLVLARMEKEALKAVDVLVKQMRSTDERIAQQAAIKVLEWHIGKPTQKTENLNKTLHAIAIVKTAMDADRL
jgi:hypothetical protein